MRRLRRVAVTGEFLVDIMKNGLSSVVVVEDGLPPDATYIGSVFDPESLVVQLLVQSESFSEVKESDIVPEHPSVKFRRADAAP